jgi:hypothetical protein
MEETKEYKEYRLKRDEKLKSVKSGENVFHLSYFSGMITPNDLAEYEKTISEIGFKFSSYDQNGDLNASLDSFTLDVCFIISQITVQSIITNSVNSATWDTIKFVVLKMWKKVRNQEITKYSSREFKKKKITFGIKVILDKNTQFDFNLKGDLSEDLILNSLDKTIKFVKSQKTNPEYKHPYFVEFDKKSGKWKSIDVEEELRKIALKQIAKKKK